MKKQYIEINAFINDLKSDQRYLFKSDPLYIAVVNETEKNLRAWVASEEGEETNNEIAEGLAALDFVRNGAGMVR